ncbi:MAG: hypothetical protein ACE5EL_05665 [Anaerolineae bacterium]
MEATLDLEASLAGGEIIVAVSGEDGSRTSVWAVGESGQAMRLWEIDPGMSASDWHVSSGTVAYRLAHPLHEVREVLVTQDLVKAAPPTTVTETRAGDGLLAGMAWAGGRLGGELHYGVVREREAPGATAATPSSRRAYVPNGWEIRRTTGLADAGQVVWRAPSADTAGLIPRLVAVDSEGRRAAIQVISAGGGASELWVVDLGTGVLRHRVGVGDIRGPIVASATGATVAYRVDGDPGARVRILDLATGAVDDLGSALLTGRGPLWALDDIVAWPDSVPGGSALRRQELHPEGADVGSALGLALGQPGDKALALSPGGDLALVARRTMPAGHQAAAAPGAGASPAGVDASASPLSATFLVVVRLADGAWAPLVWQPPGTVWRADWLSTRGGI